MTAGQAPSILSPGLLGPKIDFGGPGTFIADDREQLGPERFLVASSCNPQNQHCLVHSRRRLSCTGWKRESIDRLQRARLPFLYYNMFAAMAWHFRAGAFGFYQQASQERTCVVWKRRAKALWLQTVANGMNGRDLDGRGCFLRKMSL